MEKLAPVNRAEQGILIAATEPASVNRAESVTLAAGMTIVPAIEPGVVGAPRLQITIAHTAEVMCVAGPTVDGGADPPSGEPCPTVSASPPVTGVAAGLVPMVPRQPNAGVIGIAAGLGPGMIATRLVPIVQAIEDALAALPQTGGAQWLQRDPGAMLPFILGSILMLAGLVLRRRDRAGRHGVLARDA